jgi:aldehyde dehydrogenase (NAD+)
MRRFRRRCSICTSIIFSSPAARRSASWSTAAAKHLASVTLELGGKSPVIVDESANIAKAAKSVAWGKFTNCGQTCIAPDYAFVHETRLPQFIDAARDAIAKIVWQSSAKPLLPDINQRHFERVSRLIDDAAARGAAIAAGSGRDAAQEFIAPTLLTGVGDGALVLQEEIFGPVLPVLAYHDLAEPIAAINARPKPLALYVFAKDRARADRVLQETSAGGTCVDGSIIQFGHDNLPYGRHQQFGAWQCPWLLWFSRFLA